MTDDSQTEDTEDTQDGQGSGSADGLSPEFQKAATELIEDCDTEEELDFITTLADAQTRKLNSAQKKSGENSAMFSTDDMPKQ